MALSDPSMARAFEAAIAWWRAAGVEYDFTDDATAWLSDAPLDVAETGVRDDASHPRVAAPGEAALSPALRNFVRPSSPPPPARPDLLGDSPPADLSAWRGWWQDEPALAPPGLARIPSRGDAGAALMVLVPQPEEGDRERLLEGPQGRLLAAMLDAMGINEDGVYIASALPAFLPMADLAAFAAQGGDAVLAHHIELAAPQRILAFGTGLAPLMGRDDAQALREINQPSGNIPVMVSETLESLMEMPRLKARFWRRWMEWSAT